MHSLAQPAPNRPDLNGPTLKGPTPNRRPKRSTPAVLLSVALHLGVVAFALMLGTAARIRVIEPTSFRKLALLETAGSAHKVKFPLPPMDFAAHTRRPTKDTEASGKTLLPVEAIHPKKTGGGAPKAPHAGDGAGRALRGNGSDAEDAVPAFPIFGPHPPVSDRSLLPAQEKKIVVDVKLDALGQVLSETLVKGMGNKLDEIVLATAKTWRFQPATLNGTAVPSEAELIFPFGPGYPITGS